MNKKGIAASICILLILVIIQTMPVIMLKPFGALEQKGNYVIVYYQAEDKKGAEEVFDYLEKKAGQIRLKLELTNPKQTEGYLYYAQKSLWIRKYGLITLLVAPDWYIGDNKGEKILLVSPYARLKGNDNDHDSILEAATHELVHTINFQLNPKLSYWLDNGVATFLSGQSPPSGFVRDIPIPSLAEMKSEDEKQFGNIGGYQYSYTYIDFINSRYGWQSVLDLVNGQKSYEQIFDKSEQDIYQEWTVYLKETY